MARMIPAFCAAKAPPGEKVLFEHFRDEQLSSGWVIFHSLGLANHERQVEGEADFVVIVPNLGILVLEVKSHKSIARDDDGLWRLGNDAPTVRGPFQQAQEAKHSTIEFLRKRKIDLRNVPVVHAVWFTSIRAKSSLPASPEWQPWQILDVQDIENVVGAVSRTLSSGMDHLISTNWKKDPGIVGPNDVLVGKITSALRARFEVVMTPGDRRNAREGQLSKFLTEQYEALDMLADNDSVLIYGYAGTGKTFLAAEAAQREVSQGRTGRLICFNSMLARHLQKKLSGLEGLRVSTFHQELLRLSGIGTAPKNAGKEFWEHELPKLAIEGLVDLPSDEIGDFLIVDEAQDLAIDSYLDVMDLLVLGGFEDGKNYFFGDFEQQTIYQSNATHAVLKRRIPQLASLRLLKNCRNLPRIGYQVNLIAVLSPGYKDFRRDDDGIDPQIIRLDEGADQDELLWRSISELRDSGFELSEIVVLSPLGDNSVAASTSNRKLRQVLRPADGTGPKKGTAAYSTIHSFKGLDAPAVILTDMSDKGLANFDSLTYTGLTRATDRLIVLVETSTLQRLVGGKK